MAGKVVEKDRGLKRILAVLDDLEGWQVTVGVHGQEGGDLSGASLGQSGGFAAVEIDNVALMTLHEFGAPGAGIPERSSLRAAFDANVPKYVKLLLRGARATSRGKSTVKRALGIVGEVAVADVINLINAGIAPPNAPATIEAKGSSKPLIDTKQMVQALKPVVEKK